MKGTTKKDIAAAAGVWILMLVIFLTVLGSKQPWVPWLDSANLLIHESGHTFMAFGGKLIGALGGTIMQLLIPISAAGYFWYKNDRPGTAFGVFWTGQNLVNISVYIKDARTMLLPLVGGGTHDWNIILGTTNLLKMDLFLSGLTALIGFALMAAALGYGAYVVFDQLKQRAATPLI